MKLLLAAFILAAIIFLILKAIEYGYSSFLNNNFLKKNKSEVNFAIGLTDHEQDEQPKLLSLNKEQGLAPSLAEPEKVVTPAKDWSVFSTPACLRTKDQSWVLLLNS